MQSGHLDKKLDSTASSSALIETEISLFSKEDLSQLVHQICSSTAEEVKASSSINKAYVTLTTYLLQLLAHPILKNAADSGAADIITIINAMNPNVLKNNERCRLLYSNAHKIRIWAALFKGNGKTKDINNYFQKANKYKTKDDDINLFLSMDVIEPWVSVINKNKVEFKFVSSITNPNNKESLDLLLPQHSLLSEAITLRYINNTFPIMNLISTTHTLMLNLQDLQKDPESVSFRSAIDLGLLEMSMSLQYMVNQELPHTSNPAELRKIINTQLEQFPHFAGAFFSPNAEMIVKYFASEVCLALHKGLKDPSRLKEAESLIKHKDALSGHINDLRLIAEYRIKLLKKDPDSYEELINKDEPLDELIKILFSFSKHDATRPIDCLDVSIDFLIVHAFEDIQLIILRIAEQALSMGKDLYAYNIITRLLNANITLIEKMVEARRDRVHIKYVLLKHFEKSVTLKMNAAAKIGRPTVEIAKLLEKFSLSHIHGFHYFLDNVLPNKKSKELLSELMVDKPKKNESKEHNEKKSSELSSNDSQLSSSITTTSAPDAAVESKDVSYFLERFSTVDEIKEAIQVIIQLLLEEKPSDIKSFIKRLDNYFVKLLNEMNSKDIQGSALEIEKFISSNKHTLDYVVYFLNFVRYKLYFFSGCGCLYSNTPSISEAHYYHGSLQALIQKTNLKEPLGYSRADLKFLIDSAEVYDNFLKASKSTFSKNLDGIKIFKDIKRYLDQCRLIFISARAIPRGHIKNEILSSSLRKLDIIFKNLQKLIPAAKINQLEDFLKAQFSDLSNIQLHLTVSYCRVAILQNKINKIEALQYIDIIKKIQPLASHTFYIFDSHITQGDLYQALNEESDDPSYANLSKQCFVEACRHSKAPEVSYLINLWISLLDLKRAKTKLYDDALLTTLFSAPFPEKTLPLVDGDFAYFLHHRMDCILINALAIATEAKDKNMLFVYHFLDYITKQLMRFFVSFPPTQAFRNALKSDERIFTILQCKATLAAALTLSPDFSKEIDFLQKYTSPGIVNVFTDCVNKLFNLSLSALESKQTETKETVSEVKSSDSVTTPSLSEIHAAAHDIGESKTNTDPVQSSKEPSKDTAETKKSEAELKISQARKLLNKELISIDYRSAIFSLGEAQKALSSRLCRDTEARILKIEAALLLSDCYIETEDFKLAENEARGARDTANAIMDPAVTGPALNYLNDLLFSLPNYCRKLIINQGSDLEPYSFPEENFSQPDDRVIRLISLAKNTITKVIQKGVTPKQPVSLSSVMPIVEPQSIQDISLLTSSSSSAAVKPEEKSNNKKQDAKSSEQHQFSYAAKTKSKALKQKSQSSSAVVNHTLQSSSIISRQVDYAPKPKAEDKKQEVSSSSSAQENKSSPPQNGSHLAAFSITTEQSKALSESAVNEVKTESKGYGAKLLEKDSSKYNELIRTFLQSNKAQTTIEEYLKKLKLTPAEYEVFEKKLSKFEDTFSGDYIRIPVLVNGQNFYDIEQLMRWYTSQLEKPHLLSIIGRLPLINIDGLVFTLESLQPGWLLYNAVAEFAEEVEAYRKINKPAAESEAIQLSSMSTLSK